jgi:hypothetical protein
VWLALAVALVVVMVWPAGRPRRRGRPLLRDTGPQWRRAYGRRALLRYGVALGAAAVLAYGGADEAFDRWHTRTLDVREGRGGHRSPPSASDRVASVVKPAGQRWWFLVWLGMALADWRWRSTAVTRWGRANFEALCVGLPLLWATQYGLGANRPSSRNGSPRWHPLRHANSASGHAMLGAVPWWNLAQRAPTRAARGVLRAAGLLTGWSRLNDRKHYLSQVMLGWVIAANAVAAVQTGEERSDGTRSAAGEGGLSHP